MKKNISQKVLCSIWKSVLMFLVIAFTVTCCMSLFLNIFASNIGIEFTAENVGVAAKLTFGNVIVLTVLFTVIDMIRKKFTVTKPLNQIKEAADKIVQGDFSVRISEIDGFIDGFITDHIFDEIISCFNKMAEELSGIETLRTDFAANVSHEIKTPLAVIQNYATLLSQKDLSEEKRKEYAKAIVDASHRLNDLISNILKLSKLDNQQIFPDIAVYDLGEQLCECLIGFEDLWEKKNIDISTNIADGILVKSDREMMSLVWNNLFSNAIKFTDEGGQISLSLESENDMAIVKVKDTGCGISKEVGEHIFDKFYQGDTSHASQGNGLGLALVKRVIDITGSEISVSSEVGKGSTFTVRVRRVTNSLTEKEN